MELTDRQLRILKMVSDEFTRTGLPVSSKRVAEIASFKVSSSTIRNEFAVLEEMGMLTHPHTSAGRMPTTAGYRHLVDELVAAPMLRESAMAPVALDELATEVDTALQQTSEAMSKATNLLALVVAPRVSGARMRHVELLLLQPCLLMVVFILSTGGVTKSTIEFDEPVDPGMVDWMKTYLNETTEDQILTERLLRHTLTNRDLSLREATFLGAMRPAFERLLDEHMHSAVYVGGTARLVAEAAAEDVGDVSVLLELLEKRYLLLQLFRSVIDRGRLLVCIGEENEPVALHRFSLVAAGYGLPQRTLGAVSLLGPTRMDYGSAISTVRSTAQLLSAFLEDRYE
jgi:heat-inducible transcriptional repressor